jgi:hypothetical protein
MFTITATQHSVILQVEDLIAELNNQWKLNSIESGHLYPHTLIYTVGNKYVKIMSGLGSNLNNKSVYMFVDKNTGECYKAASHKTPAKGVRFMIADLVKNPKICDPYTSFLYAR